MPWTVLIVEDDDLTRSLLVSLLRSNGVDLVMEAASSAQALRSLGNNQVDAAILDLDLGPGPSGLDLAITLRDQMPHIGLVMLTSYSDPRLKDSAAILPRGLVYLTKQDGTDAATVLSALRQAITLPTGTVRTSPQSVLTTTQIEVLHGVAAGYTTAEIAAQRGVTTKAVEQVITRLCEILDVPREAQTNSRVQLVRKYHEMTGNLP